MTSKRPYYSKRTGTRKPDYELDLKALRLMFLSIYGKFHDEGYFQEHFGYDCVDLDFVPGKLGKHIKGVFLTTFRRDGLWPIAKQIEFYAEDDLFDIIEFLYDHISKPIPHHGDYHSYSGCGWHYSEFDVEAGKLEFRQQMDDILSDYRGGWQLNEKGEILSLPDRGIETLLSAPLPPSEPDIISRVDSAINRFRKHKSSLEDRRHALKDLIEVLEFLRPQAKEVLESKDESELFNIANNFGLRHHRQDQKNNYDRAIWHSWMFYYYLATIHACMHLIERKAKQRDPEEK